MKYLDSQNKSASFPQHPTWTQPLWRAPPPRYLFAKSTSRASQDWSSIKPALKIYNNNKNEKINCRNPWNLNFSLLIIDETRLLLLSYLDAAEGSKRFAPEISLWIRSTWRAMFKRKYFTLKGDNTHRHTGAYPLKIVCDAFYFILLLFTIALIETPEKTGIPTEPSFMIQEQRRSSNKWKHKN